MNNLHKFAYNWNLSSGYPAPSIEHHKKTVFSTFSCGGGSSMGYKLAGYDVIAANDIDPQMKKVYIENHHPKHYFLCPVKELLTMDLPDELYHLDILDGSPPCSTFSTAGIREEAWGKEKMFREGQAKQVLDDLFFDFIALAKRLQPKVVIAENVKGMLLGNAKGYVLEIKRQFQEAGYTCHIFLLNAASMGVPQTRERVFFICNRKDINKQKILLNFNEAPILFKEYSDKQGELIKGNTLLVWNQRRITDRDFSDIYLRTQGKATNFGRKFVFDMKTPKTVIASDQNILYSVPRYMSRAELCNTGSFPQDYNFLDLDDKYLIGMSVPPVMMAQIAYQVYLQWLQST